VASARRSARRRAASWTGVAPYAHGVEDILNTGPIGTGSFGGYLLGIFTIDNKTPEGPTRTAPANP